MSAPYAPLPERRLLEAISEAVRQQRTALLAGDSRAMYRQFERLLELQADLAALTAAAGSPRSGQEEGGAAALATLARRVHEEIALNQVLCRNGMAIADQYVAAAADAAEAAHQALFMGVG